MFLFFFTGVWPNVTLFATLLKIAPKGVRFFAVKEGELNAGLFRRVGEAILLIREVIIRDGRHYRTADILLAELALIACYSLTVPLARIGA